MMVGMKLNNCHRNTGFKKNLNALKQNGSPLPEFETDEPHDYFITRLFIREGFYDYDDTNQDLSEKGPEKGPETKLDEMTVRSEAVLKAIIADRKISRLKLASELNLTEKQVRASIDRLKAEGRIHFEGTGRGGYWVVD
ncbi:MAG: winged helix-turn-helix transcriptional regulator [Clostridia bacterium]|nr:winged helix-turn-helix transcriptional regulator [Clostridia bacterium]